MDQRSGRHRDPFLRKRKKRAFDDSERYADPSEDGQEQIEAIESEAGPDEEDQDLLPDSEMSDWKDADDHPAPLEGSIEKALQELTNGFSLCYRDIKDSHFLKEAPLNSLTPSRLQQIIKQKRQVLARAKRRDIDSSVLEEKKLPKRGKLSSIGAKKESISKRNLKRQDLGCLSDIPSRDLTLARQLLTNFNDLGSELQNRILDAVEDCVQKDKELLSLAIRQQVQMHVLNARQLYEQRRLGPLEQLLSQLAPSAAIMLNVEISLVSASYSEESATLSRTLLPFINKVTDYRFLGVDTHFIMGRFLSSLIMHVKDVQEQVSQGFVSLALHLNPSTLKEVIRIGNGILSLREALLVRGFQASAVNAMCLYPQKFLWPDLMQFWNDKSPDIVTQCVEILSRLDVLTDPGDQMEQLVVVLSQRSLIAKCLLKVDRIRMGISKLVRVLERLAPLDSETIQACLQEDSMKWEQLAIQSSNLEELKEQTLSTEQVESFYRTMTDGLEESIPLEAMLAVSKEVARQVEDYRHNEYQAAVACIIASQTGDLTVAVAPTGSGKTWVQGIVAKHFCRLGKKVVVIEPNDMLAKQSAEKLALADYDITITSMSRFYQEGPWHDVVILDEYDYILENHAYLASLQSVKGLWQLRRKKVIAFSATSSVSHERVLAHCLAKPKVVCFKSEYELLHGINPTAEAAVVVCADADKFKLQLQNDLEKQYEQKPVIVVIDEDQRLAVEEMARKNKWRFLDTSQPNFSIEMRQWDYGLLLLNAEEGRGLDTRFKKPAHVMILAKVQSAHEVQQMVGRSNRARGACEATLYVVGEERPAQVSERLRRHGVMSLMELERLLALLERKAKDQALVRFLVEARERKDRVASLEDLQKGLGEAVFARLMK